MARSLALLAGAFAVAAAQTSTVSFFLPLYDNQKLDASVVDVKGDATTLAIDCANSDPDECGLTDTQTVVGGASTMSMTYTIPGNDEVGPVSQDYKCNMNPNKDLFTCEVTVVGEMSGVELTVTTTTITSSGYSEYLIPITVTAGVNKLNANDDDDDETATPGASASDSAPTTASKPKATDAKATDAAADAESTESVSGSGSDAAATPVSTDNAAGPMVTQNAVLAGVAAVVGGAAMLL